MNISKQLGTAPLVLNICQVPSKDMWQVLVVDKDTKVKLAKGPMVKGKNKAYDAYTAELEKELDNRTKKV